MNGGGRKAESLSGWVRTHERSSRTTVLQRFVYFQDSSPLLNIIEDPKELLLMCSVSIEKL